ncbi:MAG: N-acetyltransferase [Bacteroidetes bacterium]|nr:N-acetyltransferase [Bacteroidota bacterium]
MDDTVIRLMTSRDWPIVKEIYEQGISTGIATFEAQAPSWEDWNSTHLESCRLVALRNELILGWAALSMVSSRCIYGGVTEVSVYVAAASQQAGVGTDLLKRLIIESEKNKVWMLNASLFPENKASLKLHKKLGFREIGYKEKVGKMSYGIFKGEWKNNILLERRSENIGIE